MARKKKHRQPTRKDTAQPSPLPKKPIPRTRWLLAMLVLAAVGVATWHGLRPQETAAPIIAPKPPYPSLTELAAMPPEQLAQVDIALMNLQCTEGLPGSEALDIPASLKFLDQAAKHVERETQHHLYRFREKPKEFQNSEAYFRLMMLAVVLQEDLGVHYNPKRIEPLDDFQPDEEFCADAKDVFLNGLTGAPMMGTCASLPVLYVAIGRRLGYPLHLVATKYHLFARWEDKTTRLNIETTARGFASYEDDYYRTWPFKITDEDVKAEGYLKTMSPTEELACFLMMRGPCLMVARRYEDALVVYREACRLAPNVRTNQLTLDANECEVKRRRIHEMNLRLDGVDYFWDREEQRRAAARAERMKAKAN